MRSAALALDEALSRLGYEALGGMANRVFLNRERGEVLKLVSEDDPVPVQYRLAGFYACQEASRRFAGAGLMPEVLEVGSDFAGTGCAYLRERYVPEQNLSVAYLERPEFWDEQLPEAILRIYRILLAQPPEDVTRFWDERLDWLEEVRASPHFPRYAALHPAFVAAARSLRETSAAGWWLHGDLQLGNLLAVSGATPAEAKVLLLDWELAGPLPLAFEFAHFYANLYDPGPQVEEHLKAAYAERRPLRRLWDRLARQLRAEFGVGGEELRQAILVHSSGWFRWIDRALEVGRAADAAYWEGKIRRLAEGEVFRELPIAD